MTEESMTIGQLMFVSPAVSSKNYREFDPYMEIRRANGAREVAKQIHVLRLLDTNQDARARSVAIALEHVLASLLEPKLILKALEQQAENDRGLYTPNEMIHISFGDERGADLSSPTASAIVREWREYIGNIALDVFFEKVLERNLQSFWNFLTNGYAIPEKDSLSEESIKQVLRATLVLSRVTTFIEYLARASSETKKGHLQKIRKFLKTILDMPLSIGVGKNAYDPQGEIPISHKVKIGISHWPEDARHTLACALVASGMYEECLDYDMKEAYQPLLYKFLGGFEETNDGFVKLLMVERPYTAEWAPLSWNEALKKACADKEWGHLLGVIIRMGLKHGRIRAQTPFAYMEYFSKYLGDAKYGPDIYANNLVLNFVHPPVMAKGN